MLASNADAREAFCCRSSEGEEIAHRTCGSAPRIAPMARVECDALMSSAAASGRASKDRTESLISMIFSEEQPRVGEP